MLPNLTIGLNECPVGIVPPDFVLECARNVLSRRQSEAALLTGTLYSPEEALKIGLIDQIALNEEEATAWCESVLIKYMKIPFSARNLTKQSIRKKAINMLRDPKSRSADAKQFIDYIYKPSTQADIENFVAKLKAKK
jgi:Delta3-Delta2-enoyl-CoA isomerase